MALKSTVFKATLQLSDMDRQYYAEDHHRPCRGLWNGAGNHA